MPGNAPRDENHVPTVLFEVDGQPGVVMPGQINEITGRILTNMTGGGGGGGDVVGTPPSTDNAVARFNGTTGKIIQNSLMTIDDAGAFIATDGSKVSGKEGGGFGYIVLAIENTDSGGRAELSFDTDDGAFAGFLTMAGSATANKARQMDIGTRVAGAIGFWTGDTERMTLSATGVSLYPTTSDSLAIGSATNQWSDLFLAEGGVINWDNGDVTLTQTGNILAVGGGGQLTFGGADGSAIVDIRTASGALQGLRVEGAATSDISFSTFVTADSQVRFRFRPDGQMAWGSGSAVVDTNLYRSTADTLRTDDLMVASLGFQPAANDGAALGSATVSFADLFLASGAVINFNNGNVTLTHSAGKLSMLGGDLTIDAAETPLVVRNTIDAASNEGLSVESDRATPANNDEVYQSFKISDSAGNQTSFARLITTATTVTDTSETADFKIQTISAGTLATRVVLNATAFRPNANDGIALGSATVSFSDLFLASGGVINFNNGNATLTHSAGRITSNVAFSIGTSNALTAGTIELGAASDTTIARVSAGVISVEGVTVPTISSTSTLTNKRIQPRTASSTSAATLTPDVSSASVYYRTTQTVGLTINAPTGTPVIGETIIIYVDSAGAQTLTINATYKAFGAAFPASTTAGKTFMMSAQYNGTDWKTLWANAV